MQTAKECLPCFYRQLNDLLLIKGTADDDNSVLEEAVRACVDEADLCCSPPELAADMHRVIRNQTGWADPFHALKQEYNSLVLSWYDELKERVRSSADPLLEAVRLAIAGNIIDFGVEAHLDHAAVQTAVDECHLFQPDAGLFADFRAGIERASSILYLGDNCGEIVFDRILIEELPVEKVTFAVRGGPILNDVTYEDAEKTGISRLVRVIDNGYDAPGTPLERCSSGFIRAFGEADLIISKGQGNYETLCHRPENIFFLFRIKCPLVSRESGRPLHSLAFLKES